jgi:hypothetical protein
MYVPAGYSSGSLLLSRPRALRGFPRSNYVRRGMGAPTLTQGAITGATSGAMIGASTATSTGSEIAGGIAGGLATTAGILAVIPGGQIPAAFLAAAASIVGPITKMFSGCGVTCQQTTDIANKVATAAGQITSAYWGNSVRTVSMRDGAVAALRQLYQYLIQNCQAIGGQGGSQCIADRQPGGKYDFQAQQIAPILNDTAVVPDPVAPGSLPSLTSFSGLSTSKLLLPGLLILAALALPTEK